MRDALACASRAYDLDPMYPWAASWYACTAEFAGRDAECRGLWDKASRSLARQRADRLGRHLRRIGLWSLELVRRSHSHVPRGIRQSDLRAAITYGQQLRESDADVSAHVLQRVRERLSRNGVLAIFDFTKLHRLGMTEEAFELIAQSSFDYMFDPDKGSPNGAEGPSMMFNVSHATAMMRDIRFVGLCDRLGLCDYWTKTGRWPRLRDAVALFYDFRAEARRLAS